MIIMVNSGVSGKGWHNENLRHSQAKKFGKASGGKVSAPKGVKKRDGSGRGTRANKGRGGCDPPQSKSRQLLSTNSPMGKWNDKTGWEVKTISTNQIKERNKKSGNHFFDKSSMRFFSSRVDPTTYVKDGKGYFITSEKFEDVTGNFKAEPRKYTIREADVYTGIIKPENDLTKFQKYNTKAQAKKGLMKYLNKGTKPSVVDISNKKISVQEAVAYHNSEAKKSLKKNDYAKYGYHMREAVKINQKARLLSMKKK